MQCYLNKFTMSGFVIASNAKQSVLCCKSILIAMLYLTATHRLLRVARNDVIAFLNLLK